MPPTSVAILGGGISGLSAAFHLARRYPTVPITVVEASTRLGGWIQTTQKPHPLLSGTYTIEHGPRTLRSSPALLELIHLLGIEDKVRAISPTSPAAKTRFIHMPGTAGLTQIPSGVQDVVFSSLGRTLAREVLNDIWRRAQKPTESDDQSLHDFILSRTGPTTARMASALGHGVYAADSRVLSARATLSTFYAAGRIIQFSRPNKKVVNTAPYELGALQRSPGVFTLENGTNTLVDALETTLGETGNVKFIRGDGAQAITRRGNEGIDIALASGNRFSASHVVSAVPLPRLRGILPSAVSHHALFGNPYTNVTVVNLVFDQPRLVPPGFGYLVTRPDDGYGISESGILGVIFDSYVDPAGETSEAFRRLTRITAMVGGPHLASTLDVDVGQLLAVISGHLRTSLPDPVFSQVQKKVGCIPTPIVGVKGRITSFLDEVQLDWGVRLSVVGAAVDGVAIGSCIEGGRNVGRNWT
ncbi:hypothetical protein BKA62DRAFT_662227 [Auriculariales sp. MPI-PUGE-AT-0066]|nr:hypothetical protein BKA62DRAFT_662227 [Auriculariales sp. MPI-PUGE-AT-0066]